MDIEEGEILISDVSSEDLNDQPQSWNKNKFQVERQFEPFRYQNTSRSSAVYNSSSSRSNQPQHYCNDDSFCRKTFRVCLANDSAGQKNRPWPRSEKFPSESVSRPQNKERIHVRQKHNQHSNLSPIHVSKKSKRRKRKVRHETSNRNKPERTLRQLIDHCESRSVLINEMIQSSRTPPSTTVTNENTSLMQKLITSGLAKPPLRPEIPSDLGIILSSSESETCVKKEKAHVINIENRDESDDSEIEVIIPPKKVPLLVTLDSDGEEEELSGKDSTNNDEYSKTLDHEHQQALASDQTAHINNTSNENKSEDINLKNSELPAGNSLPIIASEFMNKSSDSLDLELVSELCDDVQPYSPSSPSSCNSGDVNLTKNSSSNSSLSSGDISQHLQFEENSCIGFSNFSNEEISSEIWLDSNEEQTSGTQGEINRLTSMQDVLPRKGIDEDCGNSESINNEKPSFEKENSLSDLVESFIMRSTPLTEDIIAQKQQQQNKDENPMFLKENMCENELENSSQIKTKEINSYEDASSLPPSETRNENNDQLLTNTIIAAHSQYKTKTVQDNPNQNYKQCNSPHTNDSNENHISAGEQVLSDDQSQKASSNDQEPYSPYSTYDCDKSKQDDYSSNSDHFDFIATKQSFLDMPTLESTTGDLKESMSLDGHDAALKNININTEVKNTSNYANVTVIQEPELKNQSVPEKNEANQIVSNEENNKKLNKECEYHDINKSMEKTDEDDEDNVSQLRMIALLTKGKAVYKEPNSTECKTGPASNQNYNNVAEPSTSEATCGLDDDDVLQLRVAALKSAVLKKYGERKKRGLLVKKRKRAASGFTDDIFTSLENNLISDQDNSSPLSPAKSSTSLQGEEDMELADSDIGEDNIEEVNTNSVEKAPKLSNPAAWGCSSFVADCSTNNYAIPSTIHAHSRNTTPIVPPQPLPPGVDGDCPELTNQTIFTNIIPPPPPPPPPLAFTPMLPPPPPPPFPSSSLESAPQFNLPLFSDNSNPGFTINNPDKLYPEKELDNPISCTFLDPPCEEGLKNNNPIDVEPSCNDRLGLNEKSKKQETPKCQVRGNLITVPVVKNMVKPVMTKTQIRKRKKKRSKSVKVLTEPESTLLCITKLPGKSSVKVGGNINLATVKQVNIQTGYGGNYEDNPEIICSNNEGISPVMLCDTNPRVDRWKDNDNFREYEQKLLTSGMNSAKSHLSEENSMVEDEIDLSEMIVLDEVGMSPEHKSKNEGSWDYSSPQEEDEDENTLRIRALTTLSPKSVVKEQTSVSELSFLQPHSQPETYCRSWETYQPGKSTYNLGRGLVSQRVKPREVQNQRKVVGPDNSKYRLTRTLSNEQRRSVVHERKSLKVVVPTNSPPLNLPSEPPMPIVKRLVINVKDSDSEEECEWTRKIRIQDTNTSLPLGPVVDHDLERSIDELLMRARNSVDNDSSLKQNQVGKSRRSVIIPENRKMAENDLNLHDTPLKLLPKEKQEEYKRLKAILERKERERQLTKKITSSKPPEKSKPLLQHVLINENNKQNQKGLGVYQDINSDDKTKDNQSMDYKVGQSNNSVEVKNYRNEDSSSSSSSCTVQESALYNKQTKYRADFNGKENVSRKVIYNDTNKLKSSGSPRELSSDEDLQSKVLKSTDQCVRVVKNTTREKSEKNSENQQESKETTCSKFIDSSPKLLSTISSTNTVKEMQGHSDGNMQQQETTMINLNFVQNKNTKYSCGNQSETETNKSPKITLVTSKSKEEIHSSALSDPQIALVKHTNSSIVNVLKHTSDLKDEGRESEANESPTEVIRKNTASISQAKNVDHFHSELQEKESEIEANESLVIMKNSLLKDWEYRLKELEEEGNEIENNESSSENVKSNAASKTLEKDSDHHRLPELKDDGSNSEACECYSNEIIKNIATPNITFIKKVHDKDDKSCDSCEVPSGDKNINSNFRISKNNSTYTDDVKRLMNLSEETNTNNIRTQVEITFASDCTDQTKHHEEKSSRSSNENSNNIYDSNNSHKTYQDSLQNVCPFDVKLLATKKSELLNERFGLLDDLSEMAESLDDLDSQQGRLEQAAVEISDLRRALRAAEENLHKQIVVTHNLEQRFHDTHTAVSARSMNIAYLERTLQHAAYEIPTTAQKLMSKKVKQVSEKIDKVKGKRSIIKCVINNPDTTKDELTKMHVIFNMRKTENAEPNDTKVMDNLWLQDPNTLQLEDLSIQNVIANSDNKTDSETQTLSSSATDYSDEVIFEKQYSGEEITCLQTTDGSIATLELKTDDPSCGVSNITVKTVQSQQPLCTTTAVRLITEDTSSKIKKLGEETEEAHAKTGAFSNGKDSKEPCASKRSIAQVSDVSEGAVMKKPNLADCQNTFSEIEHNVISSTRISQGNSDTKQSVSGKSGTSKPSKSKFQYKSILQYRGPSSRVDSSRSGQAILCPYDLTGRCQDKQCKFQHFH